MTEQQAREAIYEAWQAGWLALHPGSALPYDTTQAECVPFVFDNEAFDESNPANFGALGAWARVTVPPSTADPASLGPPGSRRFQTKGYITVQLFVRANTGTALIGGLCDDVRTVLQGKSFTVGSESLPTFAGATHSVGKSTDGRWFQTTVVVSFLYWATQ